MTETIKRRNGRAGFQGWFASRQGALLGERERAVVAAHLPNLFGYHIVQLGSPCREHYLHGSRIGHRVICRLQGEGDSGASRGDEGGRSQGDREGQPGKQPQGGKGGRPQSGEEARLQGSEEHLPFAADSIDVIVAPHALEYAAKPHKLLREAERALIDDGHLLIMGFNPWSLWGLWRRLLAWRGRAPWNGCFYSARRLRDWLCLLDFEVLRSEKFVFLPPLRGERLRRRLAFMETVGRRLWPGCGAVYLILARKRVAPVTPVKMRWRQKRQPLAAAGVAERASPSYTGGDCGQERATGGEWDRME